MVENAILICYQGSWYKVTLNIWFQEVFLFLQLLHWKGGRRKNVAMVVGVVRDK